MKEEDPIRDHAYDGIQEYDNPMPQWWINIFIGSIVWSGIYLVGISIDKIPTYHDELKVDLQHAENAANARRALEPPVDETMLAAAIADQESIDRGADVYAFHCANCHAREAQGLIGPNLTDNAFLYGASVSQTYDVIKNGTRKGMPEWGPILQRQEMLDVIAYTFSVRGTMPKNAKKPEGDIVTN